MKRELRRYKGWEIHIRQKARDEFTVYTVPPDRDAKVALGLFEKDFDAINRAKEYIDGSTDS